VTQPFDAAQDLKDAPRTGGRMRPRDAATLILTRGSGDRLEVLMGRRAAGHVFMAGKWVFPGGRVDRADGRAASATDPAGETRARLEAEVGPYRARALMLAAVRETFEETGLRLARPAPAQSVAGPWREFGAGGALPDLAAMTYVARAITPPGRSRRFDARFFRADASALMEDDPRPMVDELEDVAWLGADDALTRDLAAITRFVLNAALEGTAEGLPFIRQVHGRHRVERL
jgi:8-oxo-dGTP pyrophosphatase MutT (NUDIX family)